MGRATDSLPQEIPDEVVGMRALSGHRHVCMCGSRTFNPRCVTDLDLCLVMMLKLLRENDGRRRIVLCISSKMCLMRVECV